MRVEVQLPARRAVPAWARAEVRAWVRVEVQPAQRAVRAWARAARPARQARVELQAWVVVVSVNFRVAPPKREPLEPDRRERRAALERREVRGLLERQRLPGRVIPVRVEVRPAILVRVEVHQPELLVRRVENVERGREVKAF